IGFFSSGRLPRSTLSACATLFRLARHIMTEGPLGGAASSMASGRPAPDGDFRTVQENNPRHNRGELRAD
ncbi:hypothetical protein QIG89_28220, partial [Klebsiella pneumoniae]|nr:hypothetical protein [Klebsiella pneumoniae]